MRLTPGTPGPSVALRRVRMTALGQASINVAKTGLLVGSFIAFTLLPVIYMPITAAMLLLSIYWIVPRGRTFLMWIAYLGGFVAFAYARPWPHSLDLPVKVHYVITIDQWLFGGSVGTTFLQGRLPASRWLTLLEWYLIAVYLSFFFAPHLMALYLSRRDHTRFLRYVIAFLATLFGGLVLYFAVPTMPPWLAAESGFLPPMNRVVEVVFDRIAPQAYVIGSTVVGPNPVAAMPSLHMGIACIVAFAVAQWGWIGRGAAVLYAASMAFALVYFGEHYVADEAVGLAIAALAWRMAARWTTDDRMPLSSARQTTRRENGFGQRQHGREVDERITSQR